MCRMSHVTCHTSRALCINAGHALRRLGRNGEALVHLEEAVAAGSGVERVNARTTMGLVLLLMGRADAAVDVLHANLSGTLDLPQTNQVCMYCMRVFTAAGCTMLLRS